MTEWGIDTLFNPGKRHMDEEKRRLQSTREEVGDSSGGKRIDLESGVVRIARPKPAGSTGLDDAELDDAESAEAELDDAELDDAESAEAELDDAELDDAESRDAELRDAEPAAGESAAPTSEAADARTAGPAAEQS